MRRADASMFGFGRVHRATFLAGVQNYGTYMHATYLLNRYTVRLPGDEQYCTKKEVAVTVHPCALAAP